MTTETNNDDELMQEPKPREPRSIEAFWHEGRLGTNDKIAADRLTAGLRFWTEWYYSRFNPEYAPAHSGGYIPDDVLTPADRYLTVYRHIAPDLRNIAESILIGNDTLDRFISRYPVLNDNAETRRAIADALVRALDQIGKAYEELDHKNK
jgi:hypothetical protein